MKVTMEKIDLVNKITLMYFDLEILSFLDLSFTAEQVAFQLSREQLREDYNFLKGEIK